MGGIGEIVDLRHALGAPVGRAGDQEGDAGVAFPPVLVRVLQPAESRDQLGIGGIGDVPDLMRLAAEGAQHVDRALVALGQLAAVAHPYHLRAARLVGAFGAGNVLEIFGVAGIGDVDDRGAIRLRLAGHRVERFRDVLGAAVMADIGDPTAALLVDGRLVSRARLQIAPAEQLHVRGFRRRTHFLLLGVRGARCQQETDDQQSVPHHGAPPWSDVAFLAETVRQRIDDQIAKHMSRSHARQ